MTTNTTPILPTYDELTRLFQETLHAVAPEHTYWISVNPELVVRIRAAGFVVNEEYEFPPPHLSRPGAPGATIEVEPHTSDCGVKRGGDHDCTCGFT